MKSQGNRFASCTPLGMQSAAEARERERDVAMSAPDLLGADANDGAALTRQLNEVARSQNEKDKDNFSSLLSSATSIEAVRRKLAEIKANEMAKPVQQGSLNEEAQHQ